MRAGLLACLMLSACASLPGGGGDLYVTAGAAAGGDGSKARPFATLSEAEAASRDGSSIYVSAPAGAAPLAGSITLKAYQKLIGVSANGEKPKLTSTGVDAVIVRLALGADVSGLHFVGMKGPAVTGGDGDYSGAKVHDNLFS